MGYWVRVLILTCMVPFYMIWRGRSFMRQTPEKMKGVIYRSSALAGKNRETWDFAHKVCGQVWYLCGSVLLPISVLPLFLVIDSKPLTVMIVVGVTWLLECITMSVGMVYVEAALMDRFDENGVRK